MRKLKKCSTLNVVFINGNKNYIDMTNSNIEKFLKGEFFFDKNKIYKLNAKIHL